MSLDINLLKCWKNYSYLHHHCHNGNNRAFEAQHWFCHCHITRKSTMTVSFHFHYSPSLTLYPCLHKRNFMPHVWFVGGRNGGAAKGKQEGKRRNAADSWWSPSICSQIHPWEAKHGSYLLTNQIESTSQVRLNLTDYTLFQVTNFSAGIFYCWQITVSQSLHLPTSVGH